MLIRLRYLFFVLHIMMWTNCPTFIRNNVNNLWIWYGQKVFAEAEEMAKKYRRKLPRISATQMSEPPISNLLFEDEASLYANWKWFKFQRENEPPISWITTFYRFEGGGLELGCGSAVNMVILLRLRLAICKHLKKLKITTWNTWAGGLSLENVRQCWDIVSFICPHKRRKSIFLH